MRYGKGQSTDRIQQEFYQLSQERGETIQQFAGRMELKYKKLVPWTVYKRHPKRAIVLRNDSTSAKFDEILVQETRHHIQRINDVS